MKSDEVLAATVRPEFELVLCCSRLRLRSQDVSQIKKIVQKGLDWNYLFRVAGRHAVIPLLHRHLRDVCPEAIPETAWEPLRGLLYDSAARNMLLTSELLKILAQFEAVGISAIPFRGPALAALAYGNLSLRQFRDLDLLIRKADLPKAMEVLTCQGYQPEPVLAEAEERAFLQSQYDREFRHETTGIMVELHWELTPAYLSFHLDPQSMWDSAEPRQLGGKEILNLAPEHLLLAICVHSTRHMWNRLGWVCDVATLVEINPGMDWGKVMDLARSGRGERMVLLGLFLAQDILGAPLPEDIRRRLQGDAVVKSLAHGVRKTLWRDADSKREILETIPFHFRVREHVRDKILYLTHMAFSPAPADWMFLPLTASHSFLYYSFRPFRLVGKFVMGIKKLRA